MVKNLIQDVIPKDPSKSIRNVQITRAKPRPTPPPPQPDPEEEFRKKVAEAREEFAADEPIVSARRPITWNPKKWIIIGSALFVVIVGFLVANLFHSAKISATPETALATVNSDIIAKEAAGAQDLPFQTISASHDASIVVKSTGEQQVDKRASGTIVIYNNYNTSPQRLIKNTRFATPEGLIFRIDQSVTVPGKSGTVPGSIEAVVFADENGEKYNVGLKDFTIPGFKGDPRYASFYARSKPGAPLAGGFSGIMKIISDSDRKAAQDALQKELTDTLMKDILTKVPEGSVAYDSLKKIDWAPLAQENLDANQVRIKETGTLSAVVFDRKALSSYLARIYVPSYKNEAIDIEGIDKLAVTPKSAAFSPATDKAVNLVIAGDAKFIWLFDEVALKQALLGKSRSQFYDILKGYPMITKADVSITPFWKGSFPGKIDKITIEKTY